MILLAIARFRIVASYFTDSTSGSTSGGVDGNCYGGSGVEVMTGEGSMEGVDNVPGNGDGFIAGSCLMLDSMLHLFCFPSCAGWRSRLEDLLSLVLLSSFAGTVAIGVRDGFWAGPGRIRSCVD
ncbi:hypothetical protein Tco_1090930 [Tanacetum coccineum]|uniref:Uncharacterized protein n=1 Tax=Tanacetum coccineum TaxID=301880 RepID=A0ABQ5I7I4_9ASTR